MGERALADLFKPGGPPVSMCWTECKVCGMGSLGGIKWYRQHECPEPYPANVAQDMWNLLTQPGSIVHPRTKARLQMSWRCGYVTPHPSSTPEPPGGERP